MRVFTSLVLILGVTPVGCKGGDPLSADIAPATAQFVQDQRPPGVTERYVYLRQSALDGGRITLDVVVADVDEPVTGIALKLTYPDEHSRFVECLDGELFPSGTCHHSQPDPASGVIFIGRSVTGLGQATAVQGEKVILRLRFLVFGISECAGAGACRIGIEGQNLGGSDASALVDIAGDPILVEWFSGELRGE